MAAAALDARQASEEEEFLLEGLMGAGPKVSIALTEELARDIEAAVASGDYSTASEVVRDALRAWERERGDRAATARRIGQWGAEGLARGEPQPMPEEWAGDIIRRGHPHPKFSPSRGFVRRVRT